MKRVTCPECHLVHEINDKIKISYCKCCGYPMIPFVDIHYHEDDKNCHHIVNKLRCAEVEI